MNKKGYFFVPCGSGIEEKKEEPPFQGVTEDIFHRPLWPGETIRDGIKEAMLPESAKQPPFLGEKGGPLWEEP